MEQGTNQAAQSHAEELVNTEKTYHWTLDGMKPYMRYSIYGGNDIVAQNATSEAYAMDDYTIWNMG